MAVPQRSLSSGLTCDFYVISTCPETVLFSEFSKTHKKRSKCKLYKALPSPWPRRHRRWAGLPEGRGPQTPAPGGSRPLGPSGLQTPAGPCGVLALILSFHLVVSMHFNNASAKNQHHVFTELLAAVS